MNSLSLPFRLSGVFMLLMEKVRPSASAFHFPVKVPLLSVPVRVPSVSNVIVYASSSSYADYYADNHIHRSDEHYGNSDVGSNGT